MPNGITTALLGFGAVLTTVSQEAGAAAAGLGVLVELAFFVYAGR